jgi:hypothetical protein
MNNDGSIDLKQILPPVPPTEPAPQSPEAEFPAQELIKINIEELKDNSVIVIKIAPEGMQQRMAATQQIATALKPHRDLIKKKNIAFLIMGTAESLQALTEEDMEDAGWVRKQKSSIILPTSSDFNKGIR